MMVTDMKRRLFILIIPALLAVSCGKDFTNLSPISDRNAASFYVTETDFKVAVNGAYDALQHNDTYGRSYALLLEMRADNTANGGGSTGLAAALAALDAFNEIATDEEIQSAWSGSYRGIARANNVLSRLEGADIDAALADQLRGEALFIRSLLYYNLALIFGNVPLQLEEVTNPNIEINQVSADVIYNQIAGDLAEAEGLLPATYASAADVGRATSGAAATLLGLVELTNGNKAAAEAALRRVVQSGVYDLVPVYADIWGPANENNIESVFEIQYTAGGLGEGSGFTDFYTPLGNSGGVGGGNAPQDLTEEIINEVFDRDNDERFWGGTFDTTGTAPDETYWVKKFESEPFGPFDADNNFIVFRYADVLLMLAEAIGESTEAYGYINEVRNRAGLPDISAADPGTFEEKLLLERRREFAFENKRWADLLRFGVAKQVMAAHLGVAESEIKLLYPIPQREIDVAPDQMQQNSEHVN
jgi:hypothetical protein